VTPLYLYALVDRPPRRPLGQGMARRPLSVLRAGKVWVVVEHASAPAVTAKKLVAHDRVVRRIAAMVTAILPLRFASTARDSAALKALLAPLAEPIGRALARVSGCVQFTLRAAGRATRQPTRSSRKEGPGTRWLARRMARERVPEIAALTEETRPFVRAVRMERQEPPRDHFATVYHLVERSAVPAWRAAVAKALPRLGSVHVTMTGPWPPYAFAELS